MTNYAVTCCGRLVALLVDDRPNSELTIVAEPESTAFIIASRIQIGSEAPYEMPQEQVKRSWGEATLSRTVWDDGHSAWTIRCDKCSKQAEMTDATYRRIADELLVTTCHQIPLLYLCKRATQLGVSSAEP